MVRMSRSSFKSFWYYSEMWYSMRSLWPRPECEGAGQQDLLVVTELEINWKT